MRTVLIGLLCLFLTAAYGQDSTAIKLQRYKELHEKGLITDQEYKDLKGKLLDLSSVPSAKKDTVDLRKLERSYKTQLVTGGILLGGGMGCFAGFIAKKDKYNDYAVATGEPKNNYLKEARICLVFGGILTGVSVYSFVKGSKTRRKYIELSSSPSSASLKITF